MHTFWNRSPVRNARLRELVAHREAGLTRTDQDGFELFGHGP